MRSCKLSRLRGGHGPVLAAQGPRDSDCHSACPACPCLMMPSEAAPWGPAGTPWAGCLLEKSLPSWLPSASWQRLFQFPEQGLTPGRGSECVES